MGQGIVKRVDRLRGISLAALCIASLPSIAGCLAEDDAETPSLFPSFVGCQLLFPDATPANCDGDSRPFETSVDVVHWLCSWEFDASGYHGWILQSPTMDYGAIRLDGPVPTTNSGLEVTLHYETGAKFTFAGDWVNPQQLFVFPNPVRESGRITVLGQTEADAKLDGEHVPTTTTWAQFEGIPTPVTGFTNGGENFHFHAFEELRAGTAVAWVPKLSFNVTEAGHSFEVRRSLIVHVSSAFGDLTWANTCDDQNMGSRIPVFSGLESAFGPETQAPAPMRRDRLP